MPSDHPNPGSLRDESAKSEASGASDRDFLELIELVSRGDESATQRLVADLEPFFKRSIRLRMRARQDFDRLNRVLSASDVCQSVLNSFLMGIRERRFSIESIEETRGLLKKMASFYIAGRARKAEVRLRGLVGDGELEAQDPRGPAEDVIIDLDLASILAKRFSIEEFDLLRRRVDDQPWAEIAAELDEPADALRKRLSRAIDRVRAELNVSNPKKRRGKRGEDHGA